MKHTILALVLVCSAPATVLGQRTFHLPSKETLDNICELSLQNSDVRENFDYTALGVNLSPFIEATGYTNLGVVACLGVPAPQIVAGGIFGEDHLSNPLLAVYISPAYFAHLQKKHSGQPQEIRKNIQAIFAHEIAHITTSSSDSCAGIADRLNYADEKILACEHSTDSLASEWVGKDEMLKALRFMNDYVMKGLNFFSHPELRDSPFVRVPKERVSLLKKAEISADAR